MTAPPPPPGMSPTSELTAVRSNQSTVTLSVPQAVQTSGFEPPEPEPIDSKELEAPVEVVSEREPEPVPKESGRLATLRAAATWYTETLGLVLVPGHYPKDGSCSCGGSDCRNFAKHPAVGAGFHSDPALQVRDREDVAKTWESSPWNICALLGQRRGFLVFDFDPRSGSDTFDKLSRDLEGIIDFSKTYHYSTSSGGSHYYFKANPDDNELWRRLNGDRKASHATMRSLLARYNGLDFKAEKSYVVAAPSLHRSGEYYTRPKDSPNHIIELTPALVDAIIEQLVKIHGVSRTSSRVAVGSVGIGGARAGYGDLLQRVDSRHDTAINDMLYGDGPDKDGAASRIVEHYVVTGTLPNDTTRIAPGSQNTNLVTLIGAVAAYVFSNPAMTSGMYTVWAKQRPSSSDSSEAVSVESVIARSNRVFPALYRMLCENIANDICTPNAEGKLYVDAEPDKFYGLMNFCMANEWAKHGLI